jgi:hypothetical protein
MGKIQKPRNSKQAECVCEQGAEQNIWTEEGWGDRRLEKTT